MTMVRQCDKCSAILPEEEEEQDLYICKEEYDTELHSNAHFSLDLCGDCVEDLKEWLQGKPTKKKRPGNRNWSPEQREKARKRMLKLHAEGKGPYKKKKAPKEEPIEEKEYCVSGCGREIEEDNESDLCWSCRAMIPGN